MNGFDRISEAVSAYRRCASEIKIVMNGWVEFFQTDEALNSGTPPAVHSVRYRMKDPDHLREKILRKELEKKIAIGPDNVFSVITDLAGVRVIHLHLDQFHAIHEAILRRINMNNYYLCEQPKAYTWDPENVAFFQDAGLTVEKKESSYTSVHYTVRPYDGSFISCEIQVRTLFEEAWGEIEHAINYPEKTTSSSCKEQIAVLAKLVGAGTRLADSIFRTHKAYGGSSAEKLEMEQPAAE